MFGRGSGVKILLQAGWGRASDLTPDITNINAK